MGGLDLEQYMALEKSLRDSQDSHQQQLMEFFRGHAERVELIVKDQRKAIEDHSRDNNLKFDKIDAWHETIDGRVGRLERYKMIAVLIIGFVSTLAAAAAGLLFGWLKEVIFGCDKGKTP